jgi:carboxylesterase
MTRSRVGRIVRWAAVVAVVVIAVAGWILFQPFNLGAIQSHPRPAHSYAEAEQRIAALATLAGEALHPECALQFLTHGARTARAIVLVHGYTNCPAQFGDLGRRYHALGYNVLIAPLPHHGLADRLSTEHALLKAEEVAAYADAVVDIAQGLGEHVTLMGISGGGVTTAWAAQTRGDVDLAVIISPAFGYEQIPTALSVPVMNYSLLAPNRYDWWDPVAQTEVPPDHAYPRYATHALAQIMRLGFAVQARARRDGPAAAAVLVVTNANDHAVNNALTAQVTALWQQRAGGRVETYVFPAELKLGHDLIDVEQPDQKADLVYAKLLELTAP